MHLAWECTTSMSTTRPRRCASSIIAFSSSGVPHRLLACIHMKGGLWLVSSIADNRLHQQQACCNSLDSADAGE